MKAPYAIGRWALLAGAALLGSACTSEEIQRETVLRISLADSLIRYDPVLIEVFSLTDSIHVLETVWNAYLPNPSQVLPKKLTTVDGRNFAVRVHGFVGTEIGLETWIRYRNGVKEVTHTILPLPTPRNQLARLNPSQGTLVPAFSKDVQSYQLKTQAGMDSVNFEILAANPKAILVLNGDTLIGGVPKNIPIRTLPDTVSIAVIDFGQARVYTVVIMPPVKVSLANLVISAGTLVPAFHPDSLNYIVNLPFSVASITVTLTSADPRTMDLTLQGKSAFSGTPSDPFPFAPGQRKLITIVVARVSETLDYSLDVRRAASPP